MTHVDGKTIYMHKLIMGTPDDMDTDHLYQVSNGICDNRKSNLKIKTHQENMFNCILSKNNTSGYMGVDYRKDRGLWRARIKVDDKEIYLGQYNTPEEAAIAYQKAKSKYHTKDYLDSENKTKGVI